VGEITLNDICDAIVDCEHKTAPLTAFGYPSVRTTNIKNGRIDWDNCNRVDEATYQAWTRRREPKPGDLILAREAPVGEVGLIPDDHKAVLGQRTVLICPDRSKVDPRYLHFLLISPDVQSDMLGKATGSTVEHLNMSDIRALPLPELPPLPEQRAIARVLGGLDDKIELNRRMNRTLEDLARGVFRSWFVDFDPVLRPAPRLPSRPPSPPPVPPARRGGPASPAPPAPPSAPAPPHAPWPTHLTDSPLGPIPEGWRVCSLREAFDVNPTRRIPSGQPAPYLDMQNMPTASAVPDEWITRACGSGMKFQNGDTLMARITPCLENGKTAYVNFLDDGQVGWGSTEYIVLRSKPPLPPEYSYFLARDEDFRSFAIANMTGSSGRQRVPASAFDKYLVVVPDAKIAAAFGEFARDVLERVRMNSEESRKLAATRDALLPVLLSGEVRLRSTGTPTPPSRAARPGAGTIPAGAKGRA
jgi:type I restriction enzyme S subunit